MDRARLDAFKDERVGKNWQGALRHGRSIWWREMVLPLNQLLINHASNAHGHAMEHCLDDDGREWEGADRARRAAAHYVRQFANPDVSQPLTRTSIWARSMS